MKEVSTYQEMLLNVVVNELTSHGAMLFAVLSSSFIFLRIINDYYKNQCYKINCFNNFIIFIFSSILFGLSLYVFIKLIFWGRMLHFTIGIESEGIYSSLKDYTNIVSKSTLNSFQDSLFEKLFIYLFLPLEELPFWNTILKDLFIGGIISISLMSALGGISRKYIKNCIMNFLRDLRIRIDC